MASTELRAGTALKDAEALLVEAGRTPVTVDALESTPLFGNPHRSMAIAGPEPA
ncbi:MAG: hypothetical protein O2975_08895 [Proteobacteria bacterium]|nr:hypothetical protein [Pseudomonadota bacterium]